MIANDVIYGILTGNTSIQAYIGAENVRHQIAQRGSTDASVLYQTKTIRQLESLDGEVFSYGIDLIIDIFYNKEEELEIMYSSIVNDMENFASINISSIEFLQDYLDYDENVDMHVLTLEFEFDYNL